MNIKWLPWDSLIFLALVILVALGFFIYSDNNSAAIFAALFSPCAAVVGQRYLDRRAEERSKKHRILEVLMASRATRGSPLFTEAFNAIPLVFYGNKKVADTWKEYYQHHASDFVPNDPVWSDKQSKLLYDLLRLISLELGYDLSNLDLKNIYYPTGLVDTEYRQHAVLKGFADVFSGEKPFPIHVDNMPENDTK